MIKGKHHFARRGSFDNLHRDYFLVNSQIGAYPKYLSHLWGFRCVYSVNRKPDLGKRVARGGSWYECGKGFILAHIYVMSLPDDRRSYLGFRCVYPLGDTNG